MISFDLVIGCFSFWLLAFGFGGRFWEAVVLGSGFDYFNVLNHHKSRKNLDSFGLWFVTTVWKNSKPEAADCWFSISIPTFCFKCLREQREKFSLLVIHREIFNVLKTWLDILFHKLCCRATKNIKKICSYNLTCKTLQKTKFLKSKLQTKCVVVDN